MASYLKISLDQKHEITTWQTQTISKEGPSWIRNFQILILKFWILDWSISMCDQKKLLKLLKLNLLDQPSHHNLGWKTVEPEIWPILPMGFSIIVGRPSLPPRYAVWSWTTPYRSQSSLPRSRLLQKKPWRRGIRLRPFWLYVGKNIKKAYWPRQTNSSKHCKT